MVAIIGPIQRQEVRFEFRFDWLTTEPMLFSCTKLLHFSPFTWSKSKGKHCGSTEESNGLASEPHVDSMLCPALTCHMILSESHTLLITNTTEPG